MSHHRNAKLRLAGRYALVGAIEAGMTLRAAAAAFSVSPATAHRWWRRWLDAGEESRRTLSCLFDRSSRPRRSPRQLAPELAEAICACRRRTGWGPRLVAGVTGFCHSTAADMPHFQLVTTDGTVLGSPPPRPARLAARQRDTAAPTSRTCASCASSTPRTTIRKCTSPCSSWRRL
jgi:transposase